jgi:hypothetical protein
MKLTKLLAIAFCCVSVSNAQVLYGSYWTGSVEKSIKLDVTTKTFTVLNTLGGITSVAQGITDFDPMNGRYFNMTVDQIKITDVQTGLVIDSIANTPRLSGIQYDQPNNRLVGFRWNGSAMIFAEVNLTTKVFTDIATLPGILGIQQAENDFDVVTGRYFVSTNVGITIIDSQTGSILDTISNGSAHMKGLRYNSITGKLIGTRWTGSVERFTTLDLTTKVFTSIDTLTGVQGIAQGESVYDKVNDKYFNKTNLGITVIDATNGNIIDTIANSIQMKGLEVYSTLEVPVAVGPVLVEGIHLFPNPAMNEVTISSEVKEKETTIFLTDLSGGKTYSIKSEGTSTKFNMEHLPSGCYMVRDANNNTKILVKP